MHTGKLLLYFCLLLCVTLPALAQVKFSTVINEKKYSKNEIVQVDYIIENASSIGSLKPPAFTGFTIVSGPMQQNGMSIVNGATSKYAGITYFLKPVSAGKFIIGGAAAEVDGKQLHSKSVAVEITNGPAGKTAPAFTNPFSGYNIPEETTEVNEEYVLKKGESAADKIRNNLFVRLDVNKTSCYAGEPVVAVYRLFSRLKSESRVAKRPSLSQFSVYDMVQPESNAPTVEKINGKLYNAHIIRKVQLYPLQDGSFDLDPVEVDNTLSFLRLEGNNKVSLQQQMDDYMNGITDGRLEEQKVTLASKPVTITVKPLPAAGKPDSFDGAVGRFTIMGTVPQMELTTNETVVLNVLLKGEGNLPLINAPQVNWPAGVEGFEPTVKEDIDKTVSPISGTKMFQYSFSTKLAGPVTIPAIVFSYFDPATSQYKTIQTDSIQLDIKKALRKAQQSNNTAAGSTSAAKGPDYKIFLWLLLFVAFAVLVIVFKRKKIIPAKSQPAPSAAASIEKEQMPPADRFEAARYALSAVNSQLFYKETGKAVWNMLSEKFNLTSSQLNKPVVLRLLQQANTPATTIQLLEKVLNDCELALYTPVHTENDMRQTMEKAEKLEQELQAQL